MPELLWFHRTALLYAPSSSSYVALAEVLETMSHERLTRLGQADWAGHTLLALAARPLFSWPSAWLIIDETGLPKPLARAIGGLAGGLPPGAPPRVGPRAGPGGWTDGTRRVPLGVRLWRQVGLQRTSWLGSCGAIPAIAGVPTRICAVRCLVSLPTAAEADWRRWVVCCVPPEEEPPVRRARRAAYRRPSEGRECGWLTGGVNVLVGTYDAQSDATNHLTLPAAVRRLYRMRAQIEKVIGVCTEQLGLTGCHARSEQAQRHHLTGCWRAVCVLERERHA